MKNGIITALAALVVAAVFLFSYSPHIPVPVDMQERGMKPFQSDQDFRDYLQAASSLGEEAMNYGAFSGGRMETSAMNMVSGDSQKQAPTRVSETNVQVLGIDEPDIAKTDGLNIYYSTYGYPVYRTIPVNGIPSYDYGDINVISAFPVEGLSLKSKIDATGEMLLSGGSLVVISGNTILGYDVSDSANPTKKWGMVLNGSVAAARLYNGKVYLVVQDDIDSNMPCPIIPLAKDGVQEVVACTSIYHPIQPADSGVSYTAVMFDPATGSVEKSVSFVGSYGTTVYMSGGSLYITYQQQVNAADIYAGFFTERGPELFPAHLNARVERIMSYDISSSSRLTEIQFALSRYMQTLGKEGQQNFYDKLSSAIGNYTAEHIRDFTKTGITRIDSGLNVVASGSIPGTLLNQFSLDEYNSNLRAAVTVGENWFWSGRDNSINDVYVLDSGLNVIGSVQDMGKGERIYSARFIEDKGYLVTFRQTDPFYVLDLSNPTAPALKGELKIPGFSSYLHPISAGRILGAGQENMKVKLSLFDVSDPLNPQEISKHIFEKYSWTEVSGNHHAFLLDRNHQVFFLPVNQAGHVFSYAGDSIQPLKTVENISAQRAVYINDYLYIIGTEKLVVLDENSWTVVKELELPQDARPEEPVYGILE